MELATLALNYLNHRDKKNYIETLKQRFKVRSKDKLFLCPSLVDD